MLTARGAAARWAAAVAACAVAVLPALAATPAGADVVRDQELWVLDMVHAPQAWNLTRGQGVTVAVIDSGVFPSVSDLAGSVIGGPDLSGVRTPMINPAWGVHGTWMASLIAGHGHAGGSSGIIGVAPAAKVLSIRVVTDRGDPHFRAYQHESNADVQQALATAITDATARGAQVISMSLGYGAASRQVRLALQDALDHRVIVVASSGNSGASPPGGSARPRIRSPPTTRACSGWERLAPAGGQPASPATTCRSRSPRPGSRCPPRAGTGSTGWSAAPARPARSSREWPRWSGPATRTCRRRWSTRRSPAPPSTRRPAATTTGSASGPWTRPPPWPPPAG